MDAPLLRLLFLLFIHPSYAFWASTHPVLGPKDSAAWMPQSRPRSCLRKTGRW